MAKRPFPPFWEARGGWYITCNGQHINLGKHPTDAPPPSKRHGKWVIPDFILQAFYAVITSNMEGKNPQSDILADGPTVAGIFEKYLAWCQKHREARAYDWYRDHIQDFIARCRRHPNPSFRGRVARRFAYHKPLRRVRNCRGEDSVPDEITSECLEG